MDASWRIVGATDIIFGRSRWLVASPILSLCEFFHLLNWNVSLFDAPRVPVEDSTLTSALERTNVPVVQRRIASVSHVALPPPSIMTPGGRLLAVLLRRYYCYYCCHIYSPSLAEQLLYVEGAVDAITERTYLSFSSSSRTPTPRVIAFAYCLPIIATLMMIAPGQLDR